jgi:penicillin amidase
MSRLDAPALLTALADVFAPAVRLLAARAMPRIRGEARLAGLGKRVEVRRDRWGVPHIYAETMLDALRAQGFVHAQDRLFQMELARRIAAGRLAERFGPIAVGTDRLARTLGFRRVAAREWELAEGWLRDALTAYCEGVNALMAGAGGRLGAEFKLLGFAPEPWTPLDLLTFGKFQAWHLSHSWSAEITRAKLVAKVGAERAAELEPRHPGTQPCIVESGVRAGTLSLSPAMRAGLASPFAVPPHEGGVGSNSWALGPGKTSTGGALLANDMHLELKLPSIWYLCHLVANDGFAVTGTGIPGMPGILVGHNARIAWGATLGFCDQQDLYVERVRGKEWEFKGAWRPMKEHREEIRVSDGSTHVEMVLETEHGPLVGSALPGGTITGDGEALALCSVALRPGKTVQGFLGLDRAKDWPSFCEAVRSIGSPDLNLVYADVDGNFGYHLSGEIPIRAKGDGRVPVPGWSGDHEWTGFVPGDEMPQALNPKDGFVVTANNRVAPPEFSYHLGSAWMNGYRAQRITERLRALDKVGPTECRDMQMDVHSLAGEQLVARLAAFEPKSDDARLAMRLLRAWNCELSTDSVGGAVFVVLSARLVHGVLDPLGEELKQAVLGVGANPVINPLTEWMGKAYETLLALLDQPRSEWFAHAGGREAAIEKALVETVAVLREKCGRNPDGWQWGKMHRVYWQHAFTRNGVLSLLFDRGPYPIGGDTDTPHQTAYLPHEPYDNLSYAPSYRQIVDLAQLDRSLVMIPGGQSGHLGSPHYDDLIPLWRAGTFIPMLWSREAVERETSETLSLAP